MLILDWFDIFGLVAFRKSFRGFSELCTIAFAQQNAHIADFGFIVLYLLQ